MRKFTLNYRLYVVAVFASGMTLLARLTGALVQNGSEVPSPADALLWVAMLAVAIVSPIPTAKWGRSASLAPAFEFAAILVFGPAVACWLSVLARVVANVAQRWDARSTLALGETAISLGIAGSLYSAMGGRSGTAFLADPGSIAALAAAGIIHLLGSHLITYGANGVRVPEFAARRFANVREAILMESVFLPFAVPLALTQLHLGMLVAGLFAAPLILARHTRITWERAKQAHFNTVRSLMLAVDAADPFMRGHSYRISKMCLRIGRELELGNDELEELEYAALLHDIGRTALRHGILAKAGALDAQEHAEMSVHPILGSDIVRSIAFLPQAAAIVRSHHERPDGTGYPDGLTGSAISIGSRIIMAVAAFDAMTSDRPYRSGMSPEAALEELLTRGGSQFFSDIVAVIIELYASGALFDDFEPVVLQQYAQGQCNSRAVEDHLRRRGVIGAGLTPEEAGSVTAHDDQEGLLVLDPPEVMTTKVVERSIDLIADGSWRLAAAALTDIGCTRTNNEDAFAIVPADGTPQGCLLVVADGMGGAAAGEVASQLAVETVRGAFQAEDKIGATRQALHEAIALANQVVVERASEDARLHGMGTTCVAAAIAGLELHVGHVGDSRAYLVGDGMIRRLTQDHNLAEELMVVAGVSSALNGKNTLTRSLGQPAGVEVCLADPIPLRDRNTIVLCSDGLSNMVQDEEIMDLVVGSTPARACVDLVKLALQRGGPDNITVAVARVERV